MTWFETRRSISPFMFLICTKALSCLLNVDNNSDDVEEISICNNVPSINHLVGFINPGSPMDLLPYKTRPSRQRSDSTCLCQPRYTIIGQDHDLVPNQQLRPGDLVRAPIGRPGCGGTVVRLRPPFSDRGYVGPLLAALFRPTRSGLTRNNRPGTPARCGPREQAEQIS